MPLSQIRRHTPISLLNPTAQTFREDVIQPPIMIIRRMQPTPHPHLPDLHPHRRRLPDQRRKNLPRRHIRKIPPPPRHPIHKQPLPAIRHHPDLSIPPLTRQIQHPAPIRQPVPELNQHPVTRPQQRLHPLPPRQRKPRLPIITQLPRHPLNLRVQLPNQPPRPIRHQNQHLRRPRPRPVRMQIAPWQPRLRTRHLRPIHHNPQTRQSSCHNYAIKN